MKLLTWAFALLLFVGCSNQPTAPSTSLTSSTAISPTELSRPDIKPAPTPTTARYALGPKYFSGSDLTKYITTLQAWDRMRPRTDVSPDRTGEWDYHCPNDITEGPCSSFMDMLGNGMYHLSNYIPPTECGFTPYPQNNVFTPTFVQDYRGLLDGFHLDARGVDEVERLRYIINHVKTYTARRTTTFHDGATGLAAASLIITLDNPIDTHNNATCPNSECSELQEEIDAEMNELMWTMIGGAMGSGLMNRMTQNLQMRPAERAVYALAGNLSGSVIGYHCYQWYCSGVLAPGSPEQLMSEVSPPYWEWDEYWNSGSNVSPLDPLLWDLP